VQTEEDDNMSLADAIVVDSDSSSDSSEALASEDELGKSIVPIQYHSLNQFLFWTEQLKKRLDFTDLCVL
jgi:mitochondrial fission protein ELM1